MPLQFIDLYISFLILNKMRKWSMDVKSMLPKNLLLKLTNIIFEFVFQLLMKKKSHQTKDGAIHAYFPTLTQ